MKSTKMDDTDDTDAEHSNSDVNEEEEEEEEGKEEEEEEDESNNSEEKVDDIYFEEEEEEELHRLPEEELENFELYQDNITPPMDFYPEMVDEEEVEKLVSEDIPQPHDFHPVFDKFSFSPRQLPRDKTHLAIMSMLKDLDIMRRWCIERKTLARFLLMAELGYKSNPYHNWKHAFSVTHFAYLLLKNLKLVQKGSLTHLEALGFMIAAICHDLDHRGTNNTFQTNCNGKIRNLYPNDSSVLEIHHLNQALKLLQIKGCNILANLTDSEFKEFREILKTVILATDLAKHFAIMHDLQDLTIGGNYDPTDSDHHYLVMCLMITACDLSDQTKEWKSATEAAKTVYTEFFNQGDLEKAMGMMPMAMMNRSKAIVPDLQVSFVEKVAIPVYKILSTIFPEATEPYRGILINRKKWVRLSHIYNTHRDDPEEETADPTDLQAILNSLEFEGCDRNY